MDLRAAGRLGTERRVTDSPVPLGNVTCLGCGCACDDVEITTRDNRIVGARNACELGVSWFGDGDVPARTRIGGRDVAERDAINAAATLLATAARPLVYLAPDLSCEAQRELVAIADALNGILDSITSATAAGSVLAAQERGRASATLGELRHRADVVVFWGVDPAVRYPRYGTRYVPDVSGLHVPDGRRSRAVVAVDVVAGENAVSDVDRRGPSDANARVVVPPAEETATITALASLVAGRDPGGSSAAWVLARELAMHLISARYIAIVADAEGATDTGRSAALITLAQSLNGPTRCALSLLRAGGNRSGADAVATWQTGFPIAVDFARGYPRYLPHEGTAHARLARGEVDAVLLAGSAALVPSDLLALTARVPRALIGPRASAAVAADSTRDIVIDTGVAGIHEAGTAMRMDDVPLPLRAPVTGSRGAADIARAVARRVRELRGPSRQAAAR
jgi:formylmethanofuran dehydrogenase subunit B